MRDEVKVGVLALALLLGGVLFLLAGLSQYWTVPASVLLILRVLAGVSFVAAAFLVALGLRTPQAQ